MAMGCGFRWSLRFDPLHTFYKTETIGVRPNECNFVYRESFNFGPRNSAAFSFIEKCYLIHSATLNELPSLSLLFLPGSFGLTLRLILSRVTSPGPFIGRPIFIKKDD